LFITRTTNRHIKQDNAVFFADHAIWLAYGYLLTMSAKEFHGRWFSKANADHDLSLK
jgi:hypothetical protein